ncbi:MAG TPA: sigma-70 family RNA polymerase sigma factor [Acidimicrobiales bacterium]
MDDDGGRDVDDDGWEQLEALYRAEQPGLVRLARLLTADPQLADELVQEAFVRLHPRLGTVDNPGGYLRTIVVNLARGSHRRAESARRLAPPPPPPVDPPDLPHDLDAIWPAVAALPDRRRQAIVLRYYADLSIDEIATLLDARPSTVRSLLHRGLASLKEVLEP